MKNSTKKCLLDLARDITINNIEKNKNYYNKKSYAKQLTRVKSNSSKNKIKLTKENGKLIVFVKEKISGKSLAKLTHKNREKLNEFKADSTIKNLNLC